MDEEKSSQFSKKDKESEKEEEEVEEKPDQLEDSEGQRLHHNDVETSINSTGPVQSPKTRWVRTLLTVLKILGVFTVLYFFICSLDLLSSGFILIGGRTAGGVFQSELLANPVCGLMVGVIFTAFLQSSSTSTSIVVTMVSAGLLTVPVAIPIIMGSNIGTSVTGVLVAVTQAGDKAHFRRAFSCATVHDMFNWLTVLILLPLEITTGYLYHVTGGIVANANATGGGQQTKLLKALTKPLTSTIVQVDRNVLDGLAADEEWAYNASLLKIDCPGRGASEIEKDTNGSAVNVSLPRTPCHYLLYGANISEQVAGLIVLVISLVTLIICLTLMVKLLKSMLQGRAAATIMKTINADFPGRCSCFTGYVAILTGTVLTILVQSSSVVASTLTPLAAVNMVTLERVYPMMLGANIGTTSTAILAAFAASSETAETSFQIALCHLVFNLTGILIWYPVPLMRKIPLRLARLLGKTTARYRWFAFAYLLVVFFMLPLAVFGLSLAGWAVMAGILIPSLLLLLVVIAVNALQRYRPQVLPKKMRSWDFLPLCLRSLEPTDHVVSKLCLVCICCPCCKALQSSGDDEEEVEEDMIDGEKNREKVKLQHKDARTDLTYSRV